MTTINPPIFGQPGSCSSTTNLGKVLISTIAFCGAPPGFYVPAAGEAAVNYAETQIAPVVDEITAKLQDIAFFLLFLIILLVVIPLFLLMIWVGFELELPNRYILLGLLFVLILTGILAFAVYRILRNSVVGQIQDAVSGLSDLFDDPATIALVTGVLNGAAGAYLAAPMMN